MANNWVVYILQSLRDGKRYTGMTSNLHARLQPLGNGKTGATCFGGPFHIAYEEKCGTRDDARVREKYFKTAAGRRFLVREYLSNPMIAGSPPERPINQ
jgi:putative endonuclease